MRTLRSYILNELLWSFLLSLAVFTFVLLMGNLIKLAELVITKGVRLSAVIKLFGHMTPYLLSYSVPMSILTAVLMCFGRLSSDNEITAMRASGISLYKIAVPPLFLGFALSVILLWVNNDILPKAHYRSRKLLAQIGAENPAAYLESGTFIKTFKNYIIFIYGIKGNKMKDIRIYQPQDDRPARTIVAKRGEFAVLPEKNTVELTLYDGTSDEPDFKRPDRFFKLNFKTYRIVLDLKTRLSRIDKKPKDMNIAELKDEITRLKNTIKHDRLEDIYSLTTEIYKKITLAFSPVAFVLIGLPLGISARRREKSAGFGIALAVIMAYYIMAVGAESLCLRGRMDPSVAMWFPNAALAAAGIIITMRAAEG